MSDDLLTQRSSRKEFLKRTGGVLAGLLLSGGLPIHEASAKVKRPFKFKYPSGTPRAVRTSLEQSADIARAYFLSTFGIVPSQTIKVSVVNKRKVFWAGFAQGYQIYFNLAFIDDWSNPPFDVCLMVMGHEIFHTLQYSLARNYFPEPFWLLEGSARFMEYALADANAFLDFADEIAWLRATVRDTPGSVFRKIESWAGFQNSIDWDVNGYALGCVATSLLTDDLGVPIVPAYFRHSGTNHKWQSVFNSTFGLPPPEFYDSYDAARQFFRPSRRPAGSPQAVTDRQRLCGGVVSP